MIEKKEEFLRFLNARNLPNEHEKMLFDRANFYIDKIKNIRGIKMIAICNSLSMFATKADSDIDLFIVTDKKMIWYVRFFVTFIFWRAGVWRKWSDIAGNFCLSFFATESALNTENFAISRDIYLYFWTYFLRPIADFDNTYEKFLQKNSWISWDENQISENKKFIKFSGKSRKIYFWHFFINNLIKFFLKRKTFKNYAKMWKPKGVIISDEMLKFHDQDQRENIKKMFENGEKYKKKIV